MANLTITGSRLSTSLQEFLECDDIIVPGSEPNYQLCKNIFTHHPLGQKMAEAPIALAQSQDRDITIGKGGLEDILRQRFVDEWDALKADQVAFQYHTLSRVYGIASVALLTDGVDSDKPLDLNKLYKQKISFSVFDPMNTAGSLIFNQNPNSLDFLKTTGNIVVNGQVYDRSRTRVKLNGQPIYLAYTASSFGFVGRSVYQSALFPLKSFVQSMITDDMVTLKAGVIVAKVKQPGSIISQAMTSLFRLKGEAVKQARTYNVLSIGSDDAIETLNMQNLDGAYGMARTNVLKNIATAADMPAILMENETFAQGLAEGSEDGKRVAQFVNRTRVEMKPTYDWLDMIVQRRAWNPEWYEAIQAEHSDYAGVKYEAAFHGWVNSFKASWPSFLQEPDSEKSKADDVKLKGLIALLETLPPLLDPQSKVNVIMWVCDQVSELKLLFTQPLDVEPVELLEFLKKQAEAPPPAVQEGEQGEPKEPLPFAKAA